MLLVVVIVGLLGAGAAENCPNRSALNVVDAWVHRDRNFWGEALALVDFHTLDGYKMIDVVKADVPVLCEGMVKNFPKLERLSLVNVNLSKIHEGAFEALPRLTQLSLSVNHLTSIDRTQFKTIPTLRVLYLSSNQIEEIEPDTFADLTALEKVYLDRNRIYEINAGWFLHLPRLSLIDLSFNKISKVQSRAFVLPKNGVVDIRLQRNIIEELEPHVAVAEEEAGSEELPYVTLHLERNNLKEIAAKFVESMDDIDTQLVMNSNLIECVSDDVLDLMSKTRVSLHVVQNPLTCECMDRINRFVEEAKSDLKDTFYYNTTVDCQWYHLKPPREWFP